MWGHKRKKQTGFLDYADVCVHFSKEMLRRAKTTGKHVILGSLLILTFIMAIRNGVYSPLQAR